MRTLGRDPRPHSKKPDALAGVEDRDPEGEESVDGVVRENAI